jgi:hypothetical protein
MSTTQPTPEPCKKNDPVFLTDTHAPTPRTMEQIAQECAEKVCHEGCLLDRGVACELIATAIAQAVEKERERADKLVRETENLRCKVLDRQDALNNLPGPAGVVALQARAEKAEAELAEAKTYQQNNYEGLKAAWAERDQLRAEVEHIKAWANAKADEAQDLRATLLAREGELDSMSAALAAAQKDKERLDWLENQGQLITRQYRDGWHFDASNGAWVCVNATTLRAAIDAARAGTANKGQP